MAENQFISGPWTGFYAYEPADKHRMDLALEFSNGAMSGSGNDDIGAFTIKGHYDPASTECCWIKRYVGRHTVFYRGYGEGKGIWGRWELGELVHGGFHIWPCGSGSEENVSLPREQSVPSDSPALPVETVH